MKYNPKDITTEEIFSGKKVIMFAVPGAFTPGCSMTHLPGYVVNADKIQVTGRKLDQQYVESRARWEPMYEVTQIKGDGEAHPFLSPDDAFADYETWDAGNLDLSEAKTDDMLAGEYAREALKNGLLLERRLGTNPYKFGMVGSSDAHTALAAMEEENYFGKYQHTTFGSVISCNENLTPSRPRPEPLTPPNGIESSL